MTDRSAGARVSKPRIPDSVHQRSQNRRSGAPASDDGPSSGRILAAAGSVSLGIGLVAVLAGTSRSDVVIEVNPTPVIVQQIPAAAEASEDGSGVPTPSAADVIVIAGATPVDAADLAPVARSEGS